MFWFAIIVGIIIGLAFSTGKPKNVSTPINKQKSFFAGLGDDDDVHFPD